MRSAICLMIVALAVGLTGCLSKPPAEPTHPDVLAKAGLKYYWQSSVPLKSGETVQSIHRLDEKVYCLTSFGRLIAVDAFSGLLQWEAPITDPGKPVFNPVHADGVRITPTISGIADVLEPTKQAMSKPYNAVMIGTLQYMVMLNRDTGEYIRGPGRMPFNLAATDRGDTDGSNYYVATYDGTFSCFQIQSGIRLWSRTSSATGNEVRAPIEVFNGKIYTADDAGNIACTSEGSQTEWRRVVDGPVVAPIHVDSRAIFLPCRNHRVYALSLTNGEPLWPPVLTNGELTAPIQVGDNSIFQYSDGEALYAIDLAKGKVRWTLPEGRTVLAGAAGKVFLLDRNNNLLAVDEMLGPQSGQLAIPLTGMGLFVANTKSPAIYAGTANGTLFCITPKDMDHLTPAALGIAKQPTTSRAKLP